MRGKFVPEKIQTLQFQQKISLGPGSEVGGKAKHEVKWEKYISASEVRRWVGRGGGTGGATATLSLTRLPLGSLRSPTFFSSSPNAEPGLRLLEMEKHNNKETEKKNIKNGINSV